MAKNNRAQGAIQETSRPPLADTPPAPDPAPVPTQETSQTPDPPLADPEPDPPATDPAPDPPANEEPPRFTKEQLLGSIWYSHRRDALTVLLKDDKTYSYEEVARKLKNFLERKVK